VTDAHAGWQAKTLDLVPGAHVAVFTGQADVGIEGRLLGLEMRDALLVLRPGPSTGLIFLFRKPCEESTVTGQVLKTGTGGINVDGCRVGSGADKGVWPITGRTDNRQSMAGPMQAVETDTTVGRWPPNVLIIHAPECRRGGTKRVKGSAVSKTFHGSYDGESNTGLLRGWSHPGNQHADKDGLETVAAWECGVGCPVPILDALSGDRPVSGSAMAGRPTHRPATDAGFSRGGSGGTSGALPNDSGGASRFYPQFVDEVELRTWMTRLISPA
jgi:hypothetical protein